MLLFLKKFWHEYNTSADFPRDIAVCPLLFQKHNKYMLYIKRMNPFQRINGFPLHAVVLTFIVKSNQ